MLVDVDAAPVSYMDYLHRLRRIPDAYATLRAGRVNGAFGYEAFRLGGKPSRLSGWILYSAGDRRESFVRLSCWFLSLRRARPLALAALLAFLAAGCGRYGPLEPPPDPNAPPKPANSNPNNLGGALAKPSIPPIKAPDRPFFLDFMLK